MDSSEICPASLPIPRALLRRQAVEPPMWLHPVWHSCCSSARCSLARCSLERCSSARARPPAVSSDRASARRNRSSANAPQRAMIRWKPELIGWKPELIRWKPQPIGWKPQPQLGQARAQAMLVLMSGSRMLREPFRQRSRVRPSEWNAHAMSARMRPNAPWRLVGPDTSSAACPRD